MDGYYIRYIIYIWLYIQYIFLYLWHIDAITQRPTHNKFQIMLGVPPSGGLLGERESFQSRRWCLHHLKPCGFLERNHQNSELWLVKSQKTHGKTHLHRHGNRFNWLTEIVKSSRDKLQSWLLRRSRTKPAGFRDLDQTPQEFYEYSNSGAYPLVMTNTLPWFFDGPLCP